MTSLQQQYRAKKLVRSGHFDLSKVQVAEVTLKSNGHDAVAIRMKSVPSMKKEPYWVMGVFDCVTKDFMCPPCSRCECPAGLGGCSHLRALYAILAIVKQLIGDHSQEEIVGMFPPALSSMKGLPIPWEYAFTDSEIEAELKTLKNIDQKSRRAIVDELALSIALDEDSGDSDSEYDPAEADDDCAGDSDDADDSGDEAADEFDPEELELDDEEADPEDVEEFMSRIQDTSESDSKVPPVFLCQFVHDMVSESAKRAEISGEEKSHEHKLEQNKIQKFLRDLLEGKGGPEESVESKLYQLRVHESLDKAFLAGKLPKNLFSFYLMHTRVHRHVHIKQLERAKELSLKKKDLNWTAQRLEKCPPGMVTLADRGFADCAVFYPYLNAVITPSFIDGRLQFSVEEIMGDRSKCESRYSSEAFFKRVWDSEFVTDKVPRHRFQYFQDLLKWSMGMANFSQPFMIPRGSEDYFPKDTLHRKRVERSSSEVTPSSRRRTKRTRDERDEAPEQDIYHPNFIFDAMPAEYYARGLDNVALLNDGKDFVTDTVRINSCVSRGQYSDKMKASAARFIAWTLPCGLSVTYSPLFLGRISEKSIVEYWGGTTSQFLHMIEDDE